MIEATDENIGIINPQYQPQFYKRMDHSLSLSFANYFTNWMKPIDQDCHLRSVRLKRTTLIEDTYYKS